MMVFKRKQVVVLSLVLMIVVAGYLQYSYNRKDSISVSGKDSGKLGEAVYVDNKELSQQPQQPVKVETKTSKAVSASKQASDFFSQAKLDKEVTRGKNADSLKGITEDKNASKEQKAKAYDQIMQITANSEKEMRIETLLKEKGFSDAFVLFGDDEGMDIVVKAPDLTSAQTAQISDIASRQAKMQVDKIHIKNIF